MKEKFLSMLGLCRRAGKLVWGYDQVVEAVKADKASGVIVASDISEKTIKNIKFETDKKGLEMARTEISKEELSFYAGVRAGVFAVCDKGFFKKLNELNSEISAAEKSGKDTEN